MDILQRLIAVEDIKRLKARYFRLVDTKAWDDLVTLFAPDAVIEIPESRPEPIPVEALIAALRRNYVTSVLVHHGHMPEIDVINEDHARGIWAMEDQRYFSPEDNPRFDAMIGAGHYHESYVRTGGGWRIQALKLTRLRLDMHERTPASAEPRA